MILRKLMSVISCCKESRAHNLSWSVVKHCKLIAKESSTFQTTEQCIKSKTVISRASLTPELRLHLITPECPLWFAKQNESCFNDDPFWAIYWPGGQALSRFILDNRKLFSGKNVLDVGSGSGACAIAAAMCGAGIVLANDTDEVSLKAVKLNAELNGVHVFVEGNNIIGLDIDSLIIEDNNFVHMPKWDVILVGDMFYSDEFSNQLYQWLNKLQSAGKEIFIGDPGRLIVEEMMKKGKFIKVAEYPIQANEYYGFSTSSVWQIVEK